MKSKFTRARAACGASLRNRRGSVAVITVLSLASLLALGGFAIDVGNVLRAKQALQAASDAAALAGAAQVSQSAASPTALTAATSWSAVSGGTNAIRGISATMISGWPKTLCLKTLQAAPYNLACTAPGGNALQVAMTAKVPLVFGALVGFKNFTVSTVATASIGGGTATNLDIALILDTTQSMTSSDPSCPVKGATRIQCAEAGAVSLLSLFNPNIDQVALFVFPGLTPGSTSGREFCNPAGAIGSPSTKSAVANHIAEYNQAPVYQIVPFSTDYKQTVTATTLNPNSNLVKALGVSGSGCTGLQVIGGASTYYADVVTAAQSYLTTSGRAKTQKVIILLSDGDANTNIVSGTPCHAAITAATTATAAGTWVYTLSYGSPSNGCQYDGGLTPCATLQQMASKPATMFYADASSSTCNGAISLTNLVAAFTKLGLSLQSRVLLPDNLS